MSVAAQADDGAEAVRLAHEFHPDVIVLDYSMPRMNGVEAARAICKARPDAHIVLLTSAATEHHIAVALAAGIRGFVLKADASDDLVRAIQQVHYGGTFVSPSASPGTVCCVLPQGGF